MVLIEHLVKMKHHVTSPRTYAHTSTQDTLDSFNDYIERKKIIEVWSARIFYSFVLMILIAEVYFIIHFGSKVINWLLK